MEARASIQEDISKKLAGIKEYQILESDEELERFAVLIQNPDKLTLAHIQIIGETYLNKYPEKQGVFAGIFTPHTNHAFARELKDNNASSPQACWNFLVDIYARLPNATGNLANTLSYIFGLAFNKNYNMYDVRPVPLMGVKWAVLPTKEIAEQLRNSVNAYYAGQYQNLSLKKK
jgi:hypothetical protein